MWLFVRYEASGTDFKSCLKQHLSTEALVEDAPRKSASSPVHSPLGSPKQSGLKLSILSKHAAEPEPQITNFLANQVRRNKITNFLANQVRHNKITNFLANQVTHNTITYYLANHVMKNTITNFLANQVWQNSIANVLANQVSPNTIINYLANHVSLNTIIYSSVNHKSLTLSSTFYTIYWYQSSKSSSSYISSIHNSRNITNSK